MMPPPLPPHAYPRTVINNSINTSSLNNSSMNSLQLSTLMATVMGPEDEDNAQSILEEHCSRIWDGSNDQTPSRSPPGGRHSPKSWSPDRSGSYSRRPPGGPGPTPNTSGISLFSGARGHHKDRRRDKDNVSVGSHFLSNKSFDSGMGEDRSGLHHHHGDGLDSQRHKHVHHYHHHHHAGGKDMRGSKQMDYEAQKEAQRRMQYHRSESNMPIRGYSEPLPGGTSLDMLDSSRGRSRDTRRTSAKKTSDSSSNIDSGVSLHYDISPHQVPNVNDPSNEK